jgi:hypothetical protein
VDHEAVAAEAATLACDKVSRQDNAMKSVHIGLLAVSLAGCASDPPTAPTSREVTIVGHVNSTVYGEPVSGATLNLSGRLVTADGAGTFTLTATAASSLALAVSANGFVDRNTYLAASDNRSGVVVDLIQLTPPFSLAFYREYVRNGFEAPDSLQPIRRWPTSPRFYFQNATVDTGSPVPDIVLDKIQQLFTMEVPQLTGGRFQAAAFDRGTDRRRGNGWVLVEVYEGEIPGSPGAGGTAAVGGDLIRLRLDLRTSATCGYQMAAAAKHEVVHTMGFWHTNPTDYYGATGPFGVNNTCNGIGQVAQLHAAVAYSRPVGNSDPDADPRTSTLSSTDLARAVVVACHFSAH